jgi:DNA-binding beta-propeller fold protein YncE
VSISLDGNTTLITTVAGNGSEGSAPNELDHPRGIFVDANSNLYVADALNNRIQLFPRGQSNGITVAGNGIPNGLNLGYPTDVILDSDGFLYIAENHEHRIIRSDHTGFECIAGCTGKNGSASNELNLVYALRFDSYGNLYVADEHNHRIQKFNLATNSCGKPHQK